MPLKKIEQNVDKTVDTWVVKNIGKLVSSADVLSTKMIEMTHEFSSEIGGYVTKWYAKLKILFPCLRDGLRIEFDAVNKLDPKHHVTCNFYVIDADENIYFVGRKNRKFDSSYFYFPPASEMFGTYRNLPDTIDKLFPNDTMTLRIELITYLDDNPVFPIAFGTYSIEPDVNLSDNFLELYKCRQDSGEVTIQVQNVGFPVHKTVLEIRCPVLYEIVARHQQTSDGNKNQLALTDIDPEIFKRVLEFIYTGKVEDLDDHSEFLLEAASKYELSRLKRMCEFSLADYYLTFQNSIEIGELAVRCNASQLLSNVRDFHRLVNLNEESLIDFSCTPSGTLTLKKLNGEKKVLENFFKNGIPEGVKIVAE